MPDVVPHAKLTHEGALKVLHAAIEKAKTMGVPQCIAIVDDGGHLLRNPAQARPRDHVTGERLPGGCAVRVDHGGGRIINGSRSAGGRSQT